MKRLAIAAGIVLIAGAAVAAEIGDLSTSDASNTTRWPENMSPAQVNDSARALEGMIARWRTDEDCSLVSTGTSSAFSVSAARTLSAYYDGLKVCFTPHSDNSGALTLNVDSIGTASVLDTDGAALEAGALQNGQPIEVVYDGSAWRVLSPLSYETVQELMTTQGDLIRGGTSGVPERLGLGNPDQVLTVTGGQAAWGNLPTASTTVSGIQQNAVQADMESEAATRTVTPDQVVQSPYVAKAWVRFTISGSAIGTINGQNVAAVAYDSTGQYGIDFTTDFSAATYACSVTAQNAAGSEALIAGSANVTAGGLTIRVVNSGGTNTNPQAVSIVCFGDRA